MMHPFEEIPSKALLDKRREVAARLTTMQKILGAAALLSYRGDDKVWVTVVGDEV
jgi:hypothetical protein